MSPVKKTTAKKTTAKETTARGGVAKKAAAAVKKAVTKATGGAAGSKKTTGKRSVVKKTTAKKTPAKKATAKKTTAKKTPAKKATAKKATAKKATAKKTPAKKTTAKKTPAKKTTAKKPAARPASAKEQPAKKTTAKKAAAGKPAAKKTTQRGTGKPQAAGSPKDAPGTAAGRGIGGSRAKETATTPGAPLASHPAKTPLKMPTQNIQGLPPRKQAPVVKPKRKAKPANLDKAALASIKKQLEDDVAEYEQQLKDLDTESFTSNQTDVSGERAGMGEDFADAGTATFDRERDLSIRNNVLDLMDQVKRALQRIEEGTYGTCESCGSLIDGDRIRAFPRSLMCIDCKRREERIR